VTARCGQCNAHNMEYTKTGKLPLQRSLSTAAYKLSDLSQQFQLQYSGLKRCITVPSHETGAYNEKERLTPGTALVYDSSVLDHIDGFHSIFSLW